MPAAAGVGSAASGALSKMRAPIAGVQRADRVPAVLGPGPRGDPQQPQPGGVAGFVLGREVAVVVDVGVDQPQRDEPPVDGVVALRGCTVRTHLLVIQANGQTGSK